MDPRGLCLEIVRSIRAKGDFGRNVWWLFRGSLGFNKHFNMNLVCLSYFITKSFSIVMPMDTVHWTLEILAVVTDTYQDILRKVF